MRIACVHECLNLKRFMSFISQFFRGKHTYSNMWGYRAELKKA